MLITYALIRLLTLPFAYLPYQAIHAIGKPLGSLAYFLIPKYRKRALSNIASALHCSNHQARTLAKKSLQSLMITCLEYPKLAKETHMANVATSVNPEKAHQIMAEGKGVIFFCGHQANWELLFLEGTSQMPGIAIGRPIKNRYLYAWVQKMRQKFGGTIVEPKHAIRAGLTALKRGAFVGIVGDQGMPDSGFASPFFGRRAYTSPMPALLAYKTQTPIIVATTHRKGGHYYITYSDPLYPDPQAPKGPEVRRLMDGALSLLEASIRAHPGQWLWIHNRWKQQTTDRIKRPYRQDIIACFVPNQPALIADLPLLRVLYPTEHITVFAPKGYAIDVADELHSYTDLAQTLLDDLRFKLIINLTGNTKIDRHYRTTAETILSVATFQQVKRKVLGA